MTNTPTALVAPMEMAEWIHGCRIRAIGLNEPFAEPTRERPSAGSMPRWGAPSPSSKVSRRASRRYRRYFFDLKPEIGSSSVIGGAVDQSGRLA